MAVWKKILLEGEQTNIGEANLEISDQHRKLIMPDSTSSNTFSIPFQQSLNEASVNSTALTVYETYDDDTGLSTNKNVYIGNGAQNPDSPTEVAMLAGKGNSFRLFGDGAPGDFGGQGIYFGSLLQSRATLQLYKGADNSGAASILRFRVTDTQHSNDDASQTMGTIEWFGPEVADTSDEVEKGSISLRNGIPGGDPDDVIFKFQARDTTVGDVQTVLEVGGSEHFPPQNGASQTATGWTAREKKLQGSRLQESSLWDLTNRFITSYEFGTGSSSGTHPSPYTVGASLNYGQRFLSNIVMQPPGAAQVTGNGVNNRGFVQMRSGYLMGGSIQCTQNTIGDTDPGRVELHVNITHPTTGSETSYFVGSDTGNQTTYNSNYNINFAAQYSDIREVYVPKGHIITPYLKVINGGTANSFRIDNVIGHIEFYSEEMYPTS